MKNAYMNYLMTFRPWKVLFLFSVVALLIPLSAEAQMPSCKNFSLGINEGGISEFTLDELLKNDPEYPVFLVIRAESQAVIFDGEITGKDQMIQLELCNFIDQNIGYRLSNSKGTCEGELFVSAPPVPRMKGRKTEVLAGDPLVKPGQLIGDTFPAVDFPCTLPYLKVTEDRVETSDCGAYDNPVRQVIYRYLEGEDQWKRSFSAEDTIVVYKFPEIRQENFTNQTMYHLECGYSENFGPGIIYRNPLTGIIDTVSLVRAIQGKNRSLDFEAHKFPEDYGIKTDLKVTRIKNTKCEKHYQLVLTWDQSCFAESGFTPDQEAMAGVSRLSRGRYRISFEVMDQDTVPPGIDIDEVISYSSTATMNCEGRVKFPDITIEDNCSGVRRAQATVSGYFTVDLKKNSSGHWVPTENVVLPFDGRDYIDSFKFDEPVEIKNSFKVIVESADSCNLVYRDSFYVEVKDEVKPSITLINNIRVGMVGKLTWLDVENLNGNSYDNCGISMVLARRVDWETAGDVNLCDGLETDKRINPVEAHYAAFMADLEKGNDSCGHWLYDQWVQHISAFCEGDSSATGMPEVGGGWTTEIPFTCEDACKEIEVEVLVIDASCNWRIERSRVKVQEKQPVQIIQEVEEEISLNCSSYGTSYAEVVEAAARYNNYPEGDKDRIAAFRALDSLLGGYKNVWQDLDGRLSDSRGESIVPSEHKIRLQQDQCELLSERKQIEYFDESKGQISTRWEMVPNVKIISSEQVVKNGIVAVNCSSSSYQKIKVEIDDCGAGIIKRRFYVASGCGETGSGDWLEKNEDRIEYVREQTIYVTPDCELSTGMFELPSPVIAVDVCEIKKNENGNYIGHLHPDFTGWPEYKWSSFCRELSVGHKDKMYQLMGNNPYGQWKLVRRWYMEDRCESSKTHSSPAEYEQIIIINEVEECDTMQDMRMISGNIHGPSGTPLPDVDVIVEATPGQRQRASTSIQGTFTIPVMKEKDYVVEPSKTDEVMKGVSTFDLVLIQKHILGKEKLKDPYQLIAADVNNNGMVDPGDILELQRGILRPEYQFPNNYSYRFVEPVSGKGSVSIQNIKEDQNIDFIGIKIGDVNFSSYKLTRDHSRSRGLNLVLQDQVLSPGQVYYLPVRSAEMKSILGLQFAWILDQQAIRSIGLSSGQIELSEENYALPGKYLTFSWFDIDERDIDPEAALFYVRLEVNKRLALSDVMKFGNEMLSSESYVEPGAVRGLEFSYHPMQTEGIQMQNRPNPFRDRTVVRFYLDEVKPESSLTIFDITGRQVLYRSFAGHMGMNEISVESADLPHAGMYYYQVVTGRDRFIGKMIHVR